MYHAKQKVKVKVKVYAGLTSRHYGKTKVKQTTHDMHHKYTHSTLSQVDPGFRRFMNCGAEEMDEGMHVVLYGSEKRLISRILFRRIWQGEEVEASRCCIFQLYGLIKFLLTPCLCF